MTATAAILIYLAMIAPCTLFTFSMIETYLKDGMSEDYPTYTEMCRIIQRGSPIVGALWPFVIWLVYAHAIFAICVHVSQKSTREKP